MSDGKPIVWTPGMEALANALRNMKVGETYVTETVTRAQAKAVAYQLMPELMWHKFTTTTHENKVIVLRNM